MALAAHEIGPAHDFVVELEAPGRPSALGFQPSPFRTCKCERCPIVDGREAARLLALAFAGEFRGGFIARIKPSSLAQFFGGGAVKRKTPRLAEDRVRRDAKPGEIDLDRLRKFLLGAFLVGVIE